MVLRPFVAAILAAAILTAIPVAADARVRISVPPRPRDAAALERAKKRLDSRLPPPAPRAVASPRAGIFDTTNFPGLKAVDNPAFAQDTPPDPTGSIGQAQYVELVNSMIGVYQRDGTLSATSNLQAFIEDNFSDPGDTFVEDAGPGSPGEDIFDIQVQWDEQAGRWLFAADDVSPDGNNHLVYGWSKDDSPGLANWCMYRTPGTATFDDYPKLGHNDAQLLIGVNTFEGFDTGGFIRSRVWSVPLPATGPIVTCPSTATATPHNLPLSVFTPVPASVTDAAGSATGYVVAAASAPGNTLSVFTVDGAGAVSAPTNFTVANYGIPPNVRQPGTTAVLDSQDGRLTQAVAHVDSGNGSVEAIWTQHTVASPDGLRSQVRWYEINPAGSLIESGSVTDVSNSVFNGAVSPAADGTTAAVQYNVGGRFHPVELRAQTRVSGQPMRGEVLVGTSDAVNADFSCTPGPCRWGDYAGASPDPGSGNDGVVWATGQLNGPIQPDQDPSWITRNFALEDDGGDTTPPDTTIDVGGFLHQRQHARVPVRVDRDRLDVRVQPRRRHLRVLHAGLDSRAANRRRRPHPRCPGNRFEQQHRSDARPYDLHDRLDAPRHVVRLRAGALYHRQLRVVRIPARQRRAPPCSAASTAAASPRARRPSRHRAAAGSARASRCALSTPRATSIPPPRRTG